MLKINTINGTIIWQNSLFNYDLPYNKTNISIVYTANGFLVFSTYKSFDVQFMNLFTIDTFGQNTHHTFAGFRHHCLSDCGGFGTKLINTYLDNEDNYISGANNYSYVSSCAGNPQKYYFEK